MTTITAPTLQKAPVQSRARRLLTDAPTRMFHWLFAASFMGAYFTAESERWRLAHVVLGYAFAGLLVFRLVYGMVGPRQARLSLMWRKVSSAPAWLRASLKAAQGHAAHGGHWRQGQNLLMAFAVIAILAISLPMSLSGYASYNDGGGLPLGEWLGDTHGLLGNLAVAVVALHLALIVGLSILRKKNQARLMLSGTAEGHGPSLVKHNRGWLALGVPSAVLAYIAWEWVQSPAGLVPAHLFG